MYSENQDVLLSWLCPRIKLHPTNNIQCLGSVVGGRIRGVVGFDNFNGASVMMHVAGEGRNWMTKDFLWAVFDYPFNVCGVNVAIALVASDNVDSLRFVRHLGFRKEYEIEGAHPGGSLVVNTMRRGECRFLNEARYGQRFRSTSDSRLL